MLRKLLCSHRSEVELIVQFLRRMSLQNGMNGVKSPRAHVESVPVKEQFGNCKTTWDPLNILKCPSSYKHAVVVLNRPILLKHSLLLEVWKKAQVTVTVDGGTNRWMTYLGPLAENGMAGSCSPLVPTLITGDMDSATPDLVDELKYLGATVINTPDQNATDYTKALFQVGVYSKLQNINLNGIYVLAETSGRFDHIIANINTLFKAHDLVGDAQVIQMASNSLTWLLRPGTHRILIPEVLIQSEAWCGLLPIGHRVNCITTNGLKWNLDHCSMEIGGLVSSSNTYSGIPEVTITTDTALIWTMGIEPLVDHRENPSPNT